MFSNSFPCLLPILVYICIEKSFAQAMLFGIFICIHLETSRSVLTYNVVNIVSGLIDPLWLVNPRLFIVYSVTSYLPKSNWHFHRQKCQK